MGLAAVLMLMRLLKSTFLRIIKKKKFLGASTKKYSSCTNNKKIR